MLILRSGTVSGWRRQAEQTFIGFGCLAVLELGGDLLAGQGKRQGSQGVAFFLGELVGHEVLRLEERRSA